MISLSCNHPDLEEFIEVKSDLNKVTKANISIRITNELMEAVKNGEDFKLEYIRETTGEVISKTVNAREIFMRIAEMNWRMAEPGVLFWDRISNYNILSEFDDFEYGGVNPCVVGNTMVLTANGSIPIKELVGKRPFVYCVDDNGEMTIKQASKVWLTRKDASLVKIKTEKSELICTPDHRVLTAERGWVEAQWLTTDDRIKGVNLKHHIGPDYPVLQVERLDYTEDVYDMTVPEVHNFVANGMVIHNCAEEPLPSGGSCLLGSINLAEFVENPFTNEAIFCYEDFLNTVREAVIALNEVLDEGLPLHPLEEQRQSVRDWRQIGLGFFGLADMLIKMGIKYGSPQSIDLCDEIGRLMCNTALKTSAMLAAELGAFPKCRSELILKSDFVNRNSTSETRQLIAQYGLRNSQLLTCAPTGSIATMLGVSTGIEPLYAFSYTRKTESLHGEDTYYKVFTPIVKSYMDHEGIDDDNDLPEYFVNSATISPEERVKMQGTWQKHIDASISSTVNLPEETTVEDVYNIYMKAWECGLKGVTIFRANCERVGILTTDSSKKGAEEKKEEKPTLSRGDIIYVNDDVVGKKRKLTTGCGSLHCSAFFDPNTGDLMETYLSKGSTGGCNNFMIGLSRMVSLAARSGCDIYSIVDQLNSCGACPSYAVRSATKKDTSKGACCPMAVGAALLDMWKEMQNDLGNDIATPVKEQTVAKPQQLVKKTVICPECGEELVFSGGCTSCPSCGYSKCD